MTNFSDHFSLAVDYDLNASRGFAEPLKDGAPIPGCGCESCTGIPSDHEARQPISPPDYSSFEERAERARSIGILEIAKRIGLETKKKGRSWSASCPLHEDRTPSLSISPEKGRAGLWNCFSCGAGGDPLELWMRTRHMGFAEAVKDLVR